MPEEQLRSSVFLKDRGSSGFYHLITNNSDYLEQVSMYIFPHLHRCVSVSDLKKSEDGMSYLRQICSKAPSFLQHFLANVPDISRKDMEENTCPGQSLMYILSSTDYNYPRGLWHMFPRRVDRPTILELVRYQSRFLSKVILNKESRALISEISSSLLLFLYAKFGETAPEIPENCSLITTEFDPVGRTCSLFWLEEKFSDKASDLKISDLERKQYEEQIKPMITLKVSPSIAGSGATSKVYKCQYNDKYCALKVISADALSSGNREIEILKKVGFNSNISGMINHAEYSKEIKIIFPLYDMDAGKLLEIGERIPVKTTVFIVHSVLKALAYLESKRIIHADVKPANILLRKTSELKMEVALCDFGLSIQLQEGKILSNAPLSGTESYVSPERLNRHFGTKTDVWSLGITFYRLLYRDFPDTKDGLVIPITMTPNVPDAVKKLLQKMICPVEKRLSAKELLKNYLWEKLMSSDWIEPEEMQEIKEDRQKLTTLPRPNVAGLVIGDEFLGKGVFGEVYAGYLRKGKERKKVAIKKIRKNPNLALKEVEQCMLIKPHKHLCKVYTCSEDSEYFYIAMEFCPSNYRKYLTENQDPNPFVAIHLEQILKGVNALYQQKIVHRDLKPENILLSPEHNIKIADFGLLKKLESSSGRASNLGTPYYKAPEVFEQHYGRRADIWSVGVIYLEMLGIDIQKEFPKLQNMDLAELPANNEVLQTGNSSTNEKPSPCGRNQGLGKDTHVSKVDNYGDPIPPAFLPDGWIPKLREFVSRNVKDAVSKEFLLSIFVIASKRPTAYQLLNRYTFSQHGLQVRQV